MIKRLQNRIAESRFALPAMAAYSCMVWIACGLIPQMMWIQFACFALSVYFIIEMNNGNMLIRIYSKMVSCSFLALTAAACFMFSEVNNAICQTLMILSYLLLFRTYQDKGMSGHNYYAFLCIGLASIANVHILYFVPAIWMMMTVFLRSLSLRTWGASILGIATPYWIGLAYVLTSGDIHLIAQHFAPLADFGPVADMSTVTMPQLATWLLVTALAITGCVHYLNTSYNDKIRIRMIYYFFISMSLLSMAWAILQPQHYDMALRMEIINTSPLIAHFIALTRTRITNAAFFLIITATLALTAYNIWMS